MKDKHSGITTKAGLLLGLVLVTLASGCVVAEPREGYYDHPHHRYYHEHVWVDCHDGDEHCH